MHGNEGTTPSREKIEAATRGDKPAIEELLVHYLPELQAFIKLNMGAALTARESASDIVQSACREVLQDINDFDYRGERAFKQLLFLQAERKLAERGRFHSRQCRDSAREVELDPDALAASIVSLLTPSREAIGREDMANFVRAVEKLPDEQRRVLLLCRGLDMTPTEAAGILGKTANAVRVTLHRALARFAVVQEQLEASRKC